MPYCWKTTSIKKSPAQVTMFLLKDDKNLSLILLLTNESFPEYILQEGKSPPKGNLFRTVWPVLKAMNNVLDLIRIPVSMSRTCKLDLSPEKIKQTNYKVCREYQPWGNCKGTL